MQAGAAADVRVVNEEIDDRPDFRFAGRVRPGAELLELLAP
jgi:hypothetical protein